MEKNVIIFTDIDGTFVNHSSYSFAEARPALNVINKYHIPCAIEFFISTKNRNLLLNCSAFLALGLGQLTIAVAARQWPSARRVAHPVRHAPHHGHMTSTNDFNDAPGAQ